MESHAFTPDQIIDMVERREIAPREGLKLLKRAAARYPDAANEPELIFYRPVWQPSVPRASAGGDCRISSGDILVLHADAAVEEVLSGSWATEGPGGSGPVWVEAGSRFGQRQAGRYTIRVHRAEDYRRLLKTLARSSGLPKLILHFLSVDSFAGPGERLRRQLENSLFSVFHLTRTLLSMKPEDPVTVLYAYVEPSGGSQPQYAAMGGFAHTLGLESTRVAMKTVSIPESSALADLPVSQILEAADRDLRFREGRCEGLRPVESVPDPHSREDVFDGLRENGVYLLTGGAGGLGFIFAAHLAKAVHARLVLTGRSPLTDEKAGRMKTLRKLGAEVVYIQADVTRSEAVKALISRTRSRFGAIHGIFHCAGATRDSLIRNKTAADIQAVIAPKVFGTLHMDEATAADPLDFFVLFSSVSAVAGNPGQCDYAYANGFMDRFAALREKRRREGRRMGRTLSINWPLWRDGGMQVDPQTERFLLESAGMSPIGSGQGLEVFFRCLMDDASQWMAVSGDGERIRQVLGGRREPLPRGRTDDIPDRPAGQEAFLPALRRDVLAIASEILKIDVEDIDWEEDISEYGFDSISFTEFANRINHRLRLNISPAVFFEQPSIRAFSTFLSENHAERLRAYYEPPGAVPPGPLLTPEETPTERKPTAAGRFWTPPPLQDSEENRSGAIAVIGMAGVMPQSEDLEAFWKHLAAGDDLITEVPESRWDWRRFASDPSIDADRIKWGGFMPDVDRFDALFFGISPREAMLMDPQQRLFMETVWKTIEDAGYRPSDLAGTRTGLFVGVATNDYVELLRENASGIDAFASTGMSHCILANRISFLLDINGPSEPIDTACSSSLVAVHRAVEAMSTGSCEMAIAGGVNVMLTPSLTIAFSKAGMLSGDGRCRTFDERADGYVRGEGVGAVLLKPLPRAVADGDHIYGVIRATAENHGGRAASLTAPNARAQANLLIECYRKAGIDPGTIGYIETHGTGTRLGDPVEINGLKRAFVALYEASGKTVPREPHCGLGAVKSNIGHLETAAGIAGIIKVLLAMRHEQIPASIHCRKVNPYIQLADTPFAIVDRTRPWEPILGEEGDRPLPRRAGISSFGYGGSNAHVVLEEYRKRDAAAPTPETEDEPHLIVLSAKNEERLKAYAGKVVRYLETRQSAISPPAPSLASIAFTLQVGRKAMEERLAAVVTDTDRLRGLLEEFLAGKTDIPELVRGNARALKGISGPMVEGRAGAGFVRMLMEDRELDKLGRLWVSGFDVDWRLLYPGKGPGRTPLPTYPFERHRHWIQSKGSAPIRRDARGHGDLERAPDARKADTVECMAFRPVWVDAPPEASAEGGAPAGNGPVLLFDVDSGRMEALSRQLRCEVVLVRPGPAYRKQGESVFRIAPDAEADYRRLVADLSQGGRPPDRVIHLWSRGPEPDPAGGPYAGPASGFFSLFHLCRAIAEGKLEDTIRLLYLYPESSGAGLPGHRAVSGFAKTLIQENPRLVLKTVAYSAHQDLEPLVSQEFRTTDSLEVRYRNGKRQVRRLAQLPGDGVDLSHLPVKENGVYLITGGAGGLGLVFAEHLARRVRADLVLAGRSALDESVQNRMKALEAGGSRVRYIRADITEREAVDRLIRTVRTQCRRIDGVIHAAGIVRDAFWIHKTVEDAAAVLGPKVTGTRLLDEATREDPLDFFVMFSSAAAVTGNPGQTDYAYANAYMDAYAGYREDLRRRGERFGKTLSVNWPLWRDGGMRVDPETETHLTRTVGMALLNREEGIANFYRGLADPGSRLVVFKGSRDRILKRLLIRRAGPKDNRPVRSKGDPKADLLHLVADIAGMDEAAVDPAADLVDYGFASISFTELANRINARFQTEIASTLFLEHPSVDSILEFLKKTLPGLSDPEETDASGGLMPIQKKGWRRPFFCVPGVGGNGHYFYHLSRCLGPEQPFYSFQSLGLHGRTEPHTEVVEMAAYYLGSLEPVPESGPFHLGGHSLGARVAYEMALQLQAAGRPVSVLVVFDEVAPVAEAKTEDYVQDDAYLICEAAAAAEAFNGIDLKVSYDELKSLSWEQMIGTMRERYQAAGLFPAQGDPDRFRGMMTVYRAQRRVRYTARPKKNPFPIVLFRAAETNRDQDEAESITNDPTWGWQRYTAHPVEVIEGPGSHNTLLAEPNARVVAIRLKAVLEAAVRG